MPSSLLRRPNVQRLLLAVFVTALAMTASATVAYADIAAALKTPSGNIRCVAERNPQGKTDWGLVCQVNSAHRRVFMKATGKTRIIPGLAPDDSDIVFYSTLSYGKTKRVGPFTCVSTRHYLKCQNRSGHGWRLSRQAQKVF